MQYLKQKELIKKSLSKVVKKLRGNKSNFIFGSNSGISTSILSAIENCKKDPQLTTIFRLAEALGVKPSDFIKEMEKELPKDFCFIEE